MALEHCTLSRYETEFADRHLIHASLDYWAERKPDAPAVVNATRDTTLNWATLRRQSVAVAAELLRRGFQKGDYLATSLPLLNQHIVLEYACFRIGAIHVPLDLRLSALELERCLSLVKPRGYVTALKAEREPAVEQFLDLAGLRPIVPCGRGWRL